MNSKKIKFGVIGVGKMGEFHTRVLLQLPAVQQVSIFDVAEARRIEVAQKYNIEPKFIHEKVEDLIENSDAICVCAATEMHFEIAQKCIQSGKHVLVEKPMAQLVAEAKTLRHLAMEKQIVLTCGHIERFNPAYQVLLDYLRRELPLTIAAARLSPFPERMATVSVIQDMMIHDLDLVLHIAQSKPDKIEVRAKKEKSSFIDEVSAKIFFENGLLAYIKASRLSDHRERMFSVGCEPYNLDANLLEKKLFKKTFAPPGDHNAFVTEEIPVENYDQLTAELNDFIKSIRRETPPQVTAEDAIAAIDLAEKIEELGKNC